MRVLVRALVCRYIAPAQHEVQNSPGGVSFASIDRHAYGSHAVPCRIAAASFWIPAKITIWDALLVGAVFLFGHWNERSITHHVFCADTVAAIEIIAAHLVLLHAQLVLSSCERRQKGGLNHLGKHLSY